MPRVSSEHWLSFWLTRLALCAVLLIPSSVAVAQRAFDFDKAIEEIDKLHEGAKFAEGLVFTEKALASAQQSFGPDDKRLGVLLRMYAEFHQELSRFREAEAIYKRSLVVLEKYPQTGELALALNSLAGLYQTTGEYSDAEPLYLRSLAIFEAGVDGHDRTENQKDEAEVLKDLAELYRAQGRFAKAEPYYDRALKLRRELNDDEGLATLLNDYAGWHRDQARYLDAEVYHKQALERYAKNKAIGVEHPDYADALNDLAESYRGQGRFAEAEPLFVRALEIHAKTLGADNHRASTVRNNFGELLRAQNRYDQAEAQFRAALNSLVKMSLTTHREYANALNSIACLYRGQGRFAEADKLYTEALKMRVQVLGNDHLDVAATLSDIAANYRLQGKFIEAEANYAKALDLYERIVGKDHIFTKTALLDLAFSIDSQNKPSETPRSDALRTRANAIPGWDVADVMVFFATNRGQERKGDQLSFGSEQKTRLADITLGRATVRAPKSEVLNRAARGAIDLRPADTTGKRQTKEESLAVHKLDHFKEGSASFLAEARDNLARATRFPKQAIIYVHGYNNTFDEAVRRTAMIAYDLRFDGLTATFSWPARSGMTGYIGDRERAEAAGPFLLHMIEVLGDAFPDVTINLIGHSTGAEAIVTALVRLADRSGSSARVKIGEVIFAHADVYANKLEAVMPSVQKLSAKVTSYSSTEDWALRMSGFIRRGDGARVGGAPVYIADVDAVDISGFGQRFALNHNLFVQHATVFGDMARLMATRRRPVDVRTPAFMEKKSDRGLHWVVKPGAK